MVCSCNQNLLGRTIKGRSTAGYDYRPASQYGLGSGTGSGVITNGFSNKQYAANNVNNNPSNNLGYYAPTTKVSSAPFTPKLTLDTGSILIGGILGLVFGYFIFTSSGRNIGHAAGTRVARKIRG